MMESMRWGFITVWKENYVGKPLEKPANVGRRKVLQKLMRNPQLREALHNEREGTCCVSTTN